MRGEVHDMAAWPHNCRKAPSGPELPCFIAALGTLGEDNKISIAVPDSTHHGVAEPAHRSSPASE
jgi:hypothetical protein